MQFIKIAGICGILLTLISLIGILSASMIFQIDWNNNTLSDMGDESSLNTKNLFNFSMIISGVFSIIFSIGGLKKGQHTITKIGFILLVISSVILIGVGIFNLPDPLHYFVASAFFILSPFAVFVIGIGLLRENELSAAILAFIVSLIGGIFTSIMSLAVLDLGLGLLNAITEFIVAASIILWIFYYSMKLIRTN